MKQIKNVATILVMMVRAFVPAIVTSVLFGLLIAAVIGVAAAPVIAVLFAISLAMGIAGLASGEQRVSGIATAGLLREVWLDELAAKFFEKDDFLMDGKDWNMWVENDAINLAEIGASPNVVRNRTLVQYPIPVTQRPDTALRLSLDDYSTDSTVVRDVEQVTISYDKRKSVLDDHKANLLQKIAIDGIYAVAPTANTTDTPVLKTSGAVSTSAGNAGNKMLVSGDVANLAMAFDNRNWNQIGRTLVVTPTVFWEFINNDPVLKEQAKFNSRLGSAYPGNWVECCGFIIRTKVSTALYNKTTLVKSAFGTVPGVNDKQASIAYIAKESFGRALGTAQMYVLENDPSQQGDVINFRQRALVLPVRQRVLGAIVSSD
jgi:hypothetical protein